MTEQQMGEKPMTMTQEETTEFYAEHKAEGLEIDPATAEYLWHYAQVLDPYGIHDLPPEAQCVGRMHFARSPGGTWVEFRDLPQATADALWKRIDSGDLVEADPF